MIELVDQYIVNRISIITFEDAPIRVYGNEPEREHGETQYPCVVVKRHEVVIGSEEARPDSYLYTASEEETAIEVPLIMGGGSLTGPVTYIRKPYPVPVDIVYEVQARSTEKLHSTKLIEALIAVFPQGHMAQVGGQFPLFLHSDDTNLDELERPLFIDAFLLTVCDLWIDRFEAETYQSIRTLTFETLALE